MRHYKKNGRYGAQVLPSNLPKYKISLIDNLFQLYDSVVIVSVAHSIMLYPAKLKMLNNFVCSKEQLKTYC